MNLRRTLVILRINLRLCLIEIASNKTRSIISSLGIFLGTASLLVNMTFVRGLESDVRKNMELMGGLTLLTIKAREAKSDEEQLSFSRSPGLLLSHIYQLKERVGFIEEILPQASLSWRRLSAGGKRTGARIIAVGERHNTAYNYEIRNGSWFSPNHFERRENVCVLGANVIERLFGGDRRVVGRSVIVDRTPFTVIGQIYTKDRFDRRAREVLIPYTVYQKAMTASPDRISEIAVRIDGVENIARAKAAFERELRALHRGVEDFEIEVNQEKIKEMQTASLGIRILMMSIAIISLTVGSVSIMNIMFATIGDRIREIGLRKALGAQRTDLFIQFLIEAVLLSFVGGIPGIFVGASFTLFPEGTFPMVPQLGWFDYLFTSFFILVAGIVSGMFPALRAANMEPVDALQY